MQSISIKYRPDAPKLTDEEKKILREPVKKLDDLLYKNIVTLTETETRLKEELKLFTEKINAQIKEARASYEIEKNKLNKLQTIETRQYLDSIGIIVE